MQSFFQYICDTDVIILLHTLEYISGICKQSVFTLFVDTEQIVTFLTQFIKNSDSAYDNYF